jgi:hypothetical protein
MKEFSLEKLSGARDRDRPRTNLRRRLKVLILHSNNHLPEVRRTSFNHAFCLLKYAPWNSYELHAFGEPISQRLRHERFDAIILDTTFLCWRWGKPREDYFDRLLREYSFIAGSDAIKIALPQDEYDHSAVLDDWMADWRVDLIYSVCYEHRDVFYPKAAMHAEIVEGLTGYIDDADVAMMHRIARPFAEREIEVGYRARNLPPYFGRFGRMKAEIGERFLAASMGSGLRLDISVDPKQSLAGDEWLRFLANCRFTLGCESGSSLLDPVGDIRQACDIYLAAHPDADFSEVEAACFPNEDMRTIFSAISPRLLEAALAGACQILVPGRYLGILKPDEHYIPLASDFSNIDTVHAQLTDWRGGHERAEACRAALLYAERLTYRGFVRDLLEHVERNLEMRNIVRAPSDGGAIETTVSDAERIHQLTEVAVAMVLDRGRDLKEMMFAQAAATGRAADFQEDPLALRFPDHRTGQGVGYRTARFAWHVLPLSLRHAILRCLYQ